MPRLSSSWYTIFIRRRPQIGSDMEKSFQQNSIASDEVVEIERDEIEGLLLSERWREDMTPRGAVVESLREELKSLCERPVLEVKSVDIERLTAITADDIIGRFLQKNTHRIVVDETAADEDIVTSADLDDEDDMVSEELAEVYLMQGLKEEAKATYRKLSLLNPEKSIYFAELIAKIDSNN